MVARMNTQHPRGSRMVSSKQEVRTCTVPVVYGPYTRQ